MRSYVASLAFVLSNLACPLSCDGGTTTRTAHSPPRQRKSFLKKNDNLIPDKMQHHTVEAFPYFVDQSGETTNPDENNSNPKKRTKKKRRKVAG